MNFTKVEKINISEQIAIKIREAIISEEIRAGQKLPSERKLAERFGTNRNTLREALKIVERDGLIKIRQGGGIEVLDFKKEGKINLLSAIIKNTKNNKFKYEVIFDSLRVRSAGLAEIARISAEKRDEANVESIKKALEEIKSHIGTPDKELSYNLEMKFLRTIVESTKSMVLMWFFNTIKDITDDAFAEFSYLWNISEEYCKSQERIFNAIKEANPEQAYLVTKEHFDNLDKKLFNLFKEVKDAQI
ncbi:MAG: GntR family transcriptional regulator [Deltaproteobacteria bacterium]|nr:GntR family transcriptional regulator [Deltaproteobacteria bacterium]